MAARTTGRRRAWRGLLLAVLVLAGAAGGMLAALYQQHVVSQPGPEFDKSHLMGVIAQESPVYYRDGQTRIGVFFEDEHRRFVGFDELPRAYVAAIVAAEDGRFFSHPGFDVRHIARAMRDNLAAGRLVAGGSTLTQQTAKNLFYRPDRSLRSKLIEALNALRLEAHYDKSEILTFYANQFHVSGNGRGLGIAAQHFFDAEVSELGVLESAFLAGLVKAPAYYDPFLGDAARRERSVRRAHDRTRYVLRRITEEPPEHLAGPYPDDAGDAAAFEARVAEVRRIQEEAERLLDEGFELPFKRGVFRYDSSAVLDEVARRLSEPPFAEVLEASDVDDPATAGLRVITTLDPDAQRAATYGLWHHLTEVGTMLEQRTAADFLRADSRGPRFDPDRVPREGQFRLATVEEVLEPEGRRHLAVDLGGHRCVVDRDGIVRAAVAVARGEQGDPRGKVGTASVDAFVDALPVGAVVWVSVRATGEDGARCDLELRPELQGAVVVTERGRIRAMVGGNDNRNFNRATALRQMGSTFKPLVLHAALELGWSPDDALDNRRGVFPFSTTMYWPRPDHRSVDTVSLGWAGVKSENLATVWLLYHLVDRLDDAELAELAATLDLARRGDEDEDAYRLRIQRAGVLPTPSRVLESDFLRARREVVAALEGEAEGAEALALQSMLYGWGFEAERRRGAAGWQRRVLDRAWTARWPRREACGDARERLLIGLSQGEVLSEPLLSGRLTDEGLELACGDVEEDAGFEPLTDEKVRGWARAHRRARRGPGEPEDVEGADTLLDELVGALQGGGRRALVSLPVSGPGELLIDGEIRASTLDAVRSAMERLALERELARGEGPVPLYDPAILYHHQDFRVLLAMRYVTALAARYGVASEVEEVLSMPLGASEITLEELVMTYEGLVTGQAWRFPGVAGGDGGWRTVPSATQPALLIAEIRDVDGRVLYRAEPEPEVVAPEPVAAMTSDILAQVVGWGTGRRARDAVRVGGAPVPLGGKTGTTNAFRNAAFVGYAPRVDGEETAPWIVGAYVGYDDNRSMVHGRIKLAGASGALPAWLGTVRGLAESHHLAPVEARAPETGWDRSPPAGLRITAVSPDDGLPVAEAQEGEDGPHLWTLVAAEPVVQVADVGGPDAQPPRVRVAPRTDDETSRARNLEDGGLWAPLQERRAKQAEGESPGEGGQ